jgi:hypothetical protein
VRGVGIVREQKVPDLVGNHKSEDLARVARELDLDVVNMLGAPRGADCVAQIVVAKSMVSDLDLLQRL